MFQSFNYIQTYEITGDDLSIPVAMPDLGKRLQIRVIRVSVTQPANVQLWYQSNEVDEVNHPITVTFFDLDMVAGMISETLPFVIKMPVDEVVYATVLYSGTEGVCKINLIGHEE